MSLNYRKMGDYQVPELTLPEEEIHLGKYGMLRRTFLREHQQAEYSRLMLSGKLNEHLMGIDQIAKERIDFYVTLQTEKDPPPDKGTDPMGWAVHMDSLHHAAEEMVLTELIYS